MPTFVLAHLSDPHLPPLPTPSLFELMGKRVGGFVNWHKRRRHFHLAPVLDRIVDDLKAQSARPHRGHRRPGQSFASGGIPAGLRLPQAARAPAGCHRRARQSRHLCVVEAAPPGAALGRLYAWRRHAGRCGAAVSIRAKTRAARPDRSRAGGSNAGVPWPPDGSAPRNSDDLRISSTSMHGHVPRRADPSSAADQARMARPRLIDGDAFIALLRKHGAELVLHGHEHLDLVRWFDTPQSKVAAVGVPSASGTVGRKYDPAAYNLYLRRRQCRGLALRDDLARP